MAIAFLASCGSNQSEENATEEVAETAPEWVDLFDGTSFDNWHIYNHPGEPVSGKWTIEDKTLVFNPEGESEWKVNDLVTDKSFENFELMLEWNIQEGGNSGIFYEVHEDSTLHTPYLSSPEIQVLDDENHPDAKQGKDGNRMAGSLYDMIPSASKANPAGEWNEVRMVKKDNHVEIYQNGTLAVEYTERTPEWDAMVEGSKFKGWEHFGKYSSGLIGLQDHGNVVKFRNIKVKEL